MLINMALNDGASKRCYSELPSGAKWRECKVITDKLLWNKCCCFCDSTSMVVVKFWPGPALSKLKLET
jgi:hypothetical protein